jgi:hypothetical protein
MSLPDKTPATEQTTQGNPMPQNRDEAAANDSSSRWDNFVWDN